MAYANYISINLRNPNFNFIFIMRGITLNKTAALNIINKRFKNKQLSKDTLLKCLKMCSLPANEVFIRAMREYPIIIKIGSNYKFVDEETIPIGRLKIVYNDYHKIMKSYQ